MHSHRRLGRFRQGKRMRHQRLRARIFHIDYLAVKHVKKPRVVVLTGAGISAESGLQTFRAADGLWEEHRVEDVATPEGFLRDPALVQRFYNDRRRQLTQPEIVPNDAHRALAQWEEILGDDFLLVTQNIDDLHERAGSQRVVHMHGELQATNSDKLIERRMNEKIQKADQLAYRQERKTGDVRQNLMERLADKLENGEFDDKMTVKDLLATLRDADNAAAKKTDQQIDIMKAMMESRSGEIVAAEVIDEEFDPWTE